MAIDIPSLQAKTTVQLKELRANYIEQRRQIPRQHRAGMGNILPTDLRRCDDAIRQINSILRARRVNKQPLKDFAS